MNAPSGISVRPAPNVERLSKRAWIVLWVLLGGIIALILYGLVKSSQAAQQTRNDDGQIVASNLAHEALSLIPESRAEPRPEPPPSAIAPPADAPPPMAAPVAQGPSAAQMRMKQMFDLEQQALLADTAPQRWQDRPTANSAEAQIEQTLATIRTQAAALGAAAQPGAIGLGVQPSSLGRADQPLGPPQPAGSPYLIQAGWDIPAVLDQMISSDLPGEVRAKVSRDVYDTPSGRYLLIPAGAYLVGRYDSAVEFGSARLLVVWDRLIWPNGQSLNIEESTGTDALGRAGLKDRVNNHWGQVVGAALLSSLFSTAFAVTQDDRSIFDQRSSSEVAASSAAQEVSRAGARITQRALSIKPTLEIRPGTQFRVRVKRDWVLSGPWQRQH